MKLKSIAVVGLALFGADLSDGPSSAYAQGAVTERLTGVERRVRHLESRVAAQDKVIVEKDRELKRLKKAAKSFADSWIDKIEIVGAVELEGAYSSPYTGDDTSDATVATAAIGVLSRVHDWVAAEIGLLYEEDDTPLEVDVAAITVGPPRGSWSFKGGQIYVPFGAFETNLISDPLTLEIGETRETAVQAGLQFDGFSATAYAFNGTNKDGGDDRIDNYGAAVGFTKEGENTGVSLGLGYINDIGDSDNLQDAIAGTLGSNVITEHVAGWTANAKFHYGPVTLVGEYLAALERFQAGEVLFGTKGARPSGWNAEVAYGFRIADKDLTAAAAYQGTSEALALGLPRLRFLAGLSVAIAEHVSLAVEWAHDKDYSIGDGGTGREADTVTTQLAVEF